MDRLSAMTSFVKVVEHSGFSSAARKLNLSTSVVTTHVRSLEDRLGVLLLNRSTRKVNLTEVGRAYYERCIRILAELEDADQIAESAQAKPRGLLRLNLAEAMPPILTAPLAEFGTLYPEVSLRVTVTSRMVDLIEEGFDLAIRVVPVPDSSLIIRRLATYRFVVCGAPSYFARHGRPEHPDELVRHNCVLFYDSPWGKEWRFSCPEEKAVPVSGNLQTNNVVVLRLAAVSGQGLICAPSFMVDAEIDSGQLIPVLTKFLPAESTIDAVYPDRRHLPAKVSSFINLAAKHLRGTRWLDAAAPFGQVA